MSHKLNPLRCRIIEDWHELNLSTTLRGQVFSHLLYFHKGEPIILSYLSTNILIAPSLTLKKVQCTNVKNWLRLGGTFQS